MKKEEIRKKGLGGIKTVIYGRTLIVILSIAIQFAILILGYLKLKDYSLILYGIFAAIGIAVVLHLFNSPLTPDIKLVWMLPIAAFPVFGALFYVFITVQIGTKALQERLKKTAANTGKQIRQQEEVLEHLAGEDGHMKQLADYMMQYDNAPVYENTSVVYFPLGDNQFPDMLEQLEKAEKFIFLEFFIVEEGEMWNAILEILKRKVKQGVEVRFMYDGMCSLKLLPNFYPKLMEREGIQCKMFCPIKPIFSSRYNNRDHRKILVIDGKVAYTGGVNLADEYINRKVRFGHWKDTGIRVTGDAVERFTDLFLEMWDVSEKTEEDYSPYHISKMEQNLSDGYVIPYGVSPYGAERIGKRVYLDILNTAQKYVHIMTPYLIFDYEMMMALTYAAKRGVDVEILMPHIPDKWYAFVVAKTYYNELLEAGVKIYEYTPGFVHAKVWVSDDEKAVVGTVNLDYRSLYHHFECAALCYRNSEIAVMEADFRECVEMSQMVTPEDYKKQSMVARVAGQLLRMIGPLM